ncbi:ABC transporter permease [Caballeronia concitans]|uniref:Binding-protein-dependent transport systems inner membrane component n=1 Tax=Caballeronia concitans TaxID=1777133 RepID=A0A658QRZ0_9BURK|nr:ABC transporter permease [Caballeronia concitans]KIG04036.1 ABC-type transporter, integral membrane subunit [Burkholderia sp. MR1]SAL15058.1 binding-protein-dependent transport systems inner membrane component [Caballeronia concitans]
MSTITPTAHVADFAKLKRIARFVGVRVLLALVTLWLLSMIVFAGGQLLPGDVGRAILGPLADARAVAALNHQLGVDRPLFTQYIGWITHFVRGDMGESYAFRAPVAPFIGGALWNSAKLGALAFVVVVPLGIAGGVYAALHAGRFVDRVISIGGLTATVVPEFVSSIVLILIFGVWLQWLPIEATAPANASVLVQFEHLILPVLPLVFVFFGYIARMARAGTVEALDADYTRTAILKGLPRRVVIFRHVLRNALLPTVTVAATQLGYMIGGLVVVETLFHYQGIGSLIYNAAKAKDFPMLEAGVLTIGVIYTAANLIADALYVVLNPRLRTGGSR